MRITAGRPESTSIPTLPPSRGKGLVALFALTLAAAAPTPPDRDHQLLELSYVLGEAHALRQVCAANDQSWRAQMQRMLEVEAPSDALQAQLAARFNQGFADARRRFPKCSPAVPKAEAAVAADGRKLAQTLARSS